MESRHVICNAINCVCIIWSSKIIYCQVCSTDYITISIRSIQGVAHSLNTRVNFWPMIHADRWVSLGSCPRYGCKISGGMVICSGMILFLFLYTLHFLMPIVLGVWIWKNLVILYSGSSFWHYYYLAISDSNLFTISGSTTVDGV